ncbi:MAG TPA: diguanylate cyclase, partial [Gemmatimonadales bacterium]|nr:diguanylate cyclase [Gemmatimonadales bacterium]
MRPVLILLGCAPVALLGALLANRQLRGSEQAATRRLNQAAALIALAIEQYLERHLDAVVVLSATTAPVELTRGSLVRRLSATRLSYPGFRTMLVANAAGDVIAASPETTAAGESFPYGRTNVGDRSYFQEPIRSGRPYRSQAFVGRTFGTDPIVAVSAPILGAGGRPVAVVEGSLDLGQLSALDAPVEDEGLLVTDSAGAVVYASPQLDLRALDPAPAVPAPRTVTGTAVLAGGWRVVLAQPRATVRREAMQAVVLTASASLAALLFAVLLAHALSGWLTEPIEQLARAVRRLPGKVEPAATGPGSRMPAEVEQLLHDFSDLTSRLQAAERTAAEDALTGIANRRRFDEFLVSWWRVSSRKGAALSLLLADVDDFKAYNDHYGHQAGDECLRKVADALRGLGGRPSDLVARIGGEEFALVFWDTTAD